MGDTKGYVVRGTWGIGRAGATPREVYAYFWELTQEVQWCSEPDKIPFDGRLYFATVGEADAARCKSSHLSDVGIYRIYADGREERLPSLEEALAEIERLRAEIADGEGAFDDMKDAQAKMLAEIERLRQENVDDRGMYDAQLANVAHERDEARAENARLNAELAKLGALKSAEVAPVIERFTAAFGADIPQAPSGKSTSEDRT